MEEQYTEGCSEESCAGCSHSGSCESQKQNAGNTAPSKAPANVGSQVKKVIGVISGKGGVGKSLVTASLARMMIEKGYTAGILDADITGPSIPKMYGSLPVDGVVIVTSPQDLVQLIVKKAYNMAKQMNIPVLGIVENYSYIKCPDCGKEIKVFGESHIDEIAKELGVPVLGKMPIDTAIAEAVEAEKFYEVTNPYLKEIDL